MWLNKVLKHLKPGSSVLDLGCGSGDPADIEISKKKQVLKFLRLLLNHK